MKFTDAPNVAFPSYLLVRMFEGVEELNYGLAKAIRAHCTTAERAGKEPAGGGFRTGEDFLDIDATEVGQLKAMLGNAAKAYMNQALPHLYEGVERLSRNLKLDGWARIIRSRQSISPHTHEGALVTGTYYVAVPKPIQESETTDGDLVLVNPLAEAMSNDLPLPVRADLHIQVNEGMLFLHPPFLPHHVPAFEGGGERLSVSFLVRPGAGKPSGETGQR